MTASSIRLANVERAPNYDWLVTLGRLLLQLKYQFTTVTPAAHELINSRPGNQVARTLQDVFGWGRRFEPAVLPAQLFEAMRLAGACRPVARSELWQPQVRFSTLEGLLFAHSAFPTLEQDAVFFGPDSYRFVRAIEARVRNAARIVDVGCGCGVGAIALARRGLGSAPVVLADVNANALRMAAVNAELASVRAITVQSDVLREVQGEFDLVIANPPYLRDDAQRTYRDGGGDYGEQLAARITRESIERLSAMPKGGRLLLYTGAAIVSGDDTFLNAVRRELVRPGVRHAYEEIDPDVFSEELRRPAYASVERIAAVLLDVQVAGTRASLPLVAS